MMAESRAPASVVVFGAHGSGVSVLAAHLGLLAGGIDARSADKVEKELTAAGAGSHTKERKFSWLLDRTARERQLGSSLRVSRFKMDTQQRTFTVFATPGLPSSVRTLIPAVAQSDVGVLVVDVNDVEACVAKNSHTMELALLAYTFGVRELIVVVNKMDAPQVRFSSALFEAARTEMSKALRKVGFSDSVRFVPASGLVGTNLVAREQGMSWWKGPTLVQTLDQATLPERHTEKPLRIIVRDVFAPNILAGRVEQGTIQVGQVVTLAPRMITSTVESIHIHGSPVERAAAGHVVGVTLAGVDVAELSRADVLGDASDPPRRCVQFVVRLVVVKPCVMRVGYTPVMACHTAQFPCQFAKLLRKTDMKTKTKTMANPTELRQHEQCDVLVVPKVPVCVDTFEACPSLGRFAIRDLGVTMAVGFVRSVVFEESKRVRVAREQMHKIR